MSVSAFPSVCLTLSFAGALYVLSLGAPDRQQMITDSLPIPAVMELLDGPVSASAAAGLLGLMSTNRRHKRELCDMHKVPQKLVQVLERAMTSPASDANELLLIRVGLWWPRVPFLVDLRLVSTAAALCSVQVFADRASAADTL